MYKCFFKRVIDILVALTGIMVLAAPMVVVALIIKLDSPGPVFFLQKRVGYRKNHFYIIKFRSMSVTVPRDVPTHQLSREKLCLTKWQRFLRASSLDELPQLLNVLSGSMSLIGPRPALWNQYDLIWEREQYGANDIKPGITGWAQINGRDELSVAAKARFDGEYVQRLSFLFDCRCLLGTVRTVLGAEGNADSKTEGEAARR